MATKRSLDCLGTDRDECDTKKQKQDDVEYTSVSESLTEFDREECDSVDSDNESDNTGSDSEYESGDDGSSDDSGDDGSDSEDDCVITVVLPERKCCPDCNYVYGSDAVVTLSSMEKDELVARSFDITDMANSSMVLESAAALALHHIRCIRNRSSFDEELPEEPKEVKDFQVPSYDLKCFVCQLKTDEHQYFMLSEEEAKYLNTYLTVTTQKYKEGSSYLDRLAMIFIHNLRCFRNIPRYQDGCIWISDVNCGSYYEPISDDENIPDDS